MIAESAEVATTVTIPPSVRVWDFAKIRDGAEIGDNVVIGQGVYIGLNVSIGANSKIQNQAQIYDPAVIGNGVFIGPGAILTNDRFPRAVTPEGQQRGPTHWDPIGVEVQQGASIGAGAVCIAPVAIGRWAMVAAGAVVVRDVPDFALVVGIPARQVGWVGRSGLRLIQTGDAAGHWICPQTNERYIQESQGTLVFEDKSPK